MLKAMSNWWRTLPLSRGVGFKAVTKNPRLWKSMPMEAAQEKAFAKETAATISDEDLASLAEYFLFETAHSDDAWLAGRTLQEVEPSRLSKLFESIVENPANAGRLVTAKKKKSKSQTETPLERLCGLVDDGNCPPSVAKFARHPEDTIREAAVLALCSTGGLEMVPIFKEASEDEEEGVQSYALMGLDRALKASRLNARAVPLVYPIVLRMVQQETGNCGDCAKILMRLDHSKAVSDLQSDGLLNVDFPELFEILQCFGEAKALPARDKLEQLLIGLEPRSREYPDDNSLGGVLRLIGHHRLAGDEKRLAFYMEEGNDEVAEGAAAGWLAFHGMERAHEVACVGDAPATTPAPLKQYYAIHMMDAEICNGGFSQYFFNSSGDAWKLAMSGLEEAGSTERLALLKEAVAKIAGGNPSSNRETRGNQLAKALKTNDEIFEDLETRYYAGKEHIQVLLTKLVMKHQETFRRQIEANPNRE